MLPKSFIFQWRLAIGLLILTSAIAPLALNYYVRLVTSNYLRTDVAKVPAEPIAIVFGAGVWEDGTPTPMLADRVQAAIDLYKAERVSQLLITGDNSSKDYSEVKAMQEYAEAQGIAALRSHPQWKWESLYYKKHRLGIRNWMLKLKDSWQSGRIPSLYYQ